MTTAMLLRLLADQLQDLDPNGPVPGPLVKAARRRAEELDVAAPMTLDDLKRVEGGPDKTFLFHLSEDYPEPDAADMERISACFHRELNGAKVIVVPAGCRVKPMEKESREESFERITLNAEPLLLGMRYGPAEFDSVEPAPQPAPPPAADKPCGVPIPDHLQGAFSAVLKECEEKGFVQGPLVQIPLPGPDYDLMLCGCGWQGKLARATWDADGWPHCPECKGRVETASRAAEPPADEPKKIKFHEFL